MSTDPPMKLLGDRYEVGPVIGRGAMGEVRRGRDLRLDREVAIKYLRPDLAADADVRARFEEEARSAARLSHPAIVTVFDSGEDDAGRPYLVMECLPGTTLAGELAAGPIPATRVAAVAGSIAGALAAAHAVGVVHRDVKPGNILLTETGEVKLADFGIAKSTDGADLTATDMIVGTPAYLAPERLAGHPATAASDVYSLGVVLYEALTGDKPFRGDTPVALAHAIHTATPAPVGTLVPGADPSLAMAIDRALERDPSARPSSGRAMARLLDAGGTATLAVSPVPGDATVPMAAASTATMPMPPRPPDAAGTREVSGRRRVGLDSPGGRVAALAAAVALVLGVVWLATDGTGSDATGTTTTTATAGPVGEVDLPPALDGAIRQLEEAVRP